MIVTRQIAFAVLIVSALIGGVVAQEYPIYPIRLVVGYPPGGGMDFMARALASTLSETLGAQVVVDNRGGAHGIIGAQTVVKAASDGYTLGLVSVSSLVLNPVLYSNAPHPLRDYTLITLVGRSPLAIGVHPGVPTQSLKELIALARSKPGTLNFGAPGVGGITHLAIELINSVAKIKLIPVPYQGTGRMLSEVLGGQIEGMVGNIPSFVGPAKVGKLRVLAVTSDDRAGVLREVPSVREQGMPELEISTWHAIVAPPNLSAALTNKLYAAVVKTISTPAVADKLVVGGIDPYTSPSSAAFARFVRIEFERWGKVVKDSGIKIDE